MVKPSLVWFPCTPRGTVRCFLWTLVAGRAITLPVLRMPRMESKVKQRVKEFLSQRKTQLLHWVVDVLKLWWLRKFLGTRKT